MIKEAIIKLSKKEDLTYDEAEAVMNEIMDGAATPVQMASYLTALSLKGETIDEITASAAGMRAHCIKLLHDMNVLEIVGTGGDGANSFNISTTSSLVIAAGGFRDITRIASSSPVMWEQICIENHENISSVLDEYIRMLIQIRCSIDNQEASYLYDMFARSRDYRDSIDASSSGLINKTYMLYIDIVDEAGGIATIATILAMEGISIKNIGIIHNREFEQGVLKIEFYEQNALEKGCALLKKRNYIVYER